MCTIYMAMDRIPDNIMRTLDNEICIWVIERLKMSVDNVRVKVLCQNIHGFSSKFENDLIAVVLFDKIKRGMNIYY